MARAIPHTVSLTEVPQFRRLVQFVADVEDHANENHDFELWSLIADLRRDLLGTDDDD